MWRPRRVNSRVIANQRLLTPGNDYDGDVLNFDSNLSIPLNKKRKAAEDSWPKGNQEKRKHSMCSDVSTFLRGGAKSGKYPWPGWPTVPVASRFANSSMATLEVGSNDSGIYKFHVHESILCELNFFKAALRGGFKEASSRLIKMPEDDPVLITSFVEFLYSGDYREPALTELSGDEADIKKQFVQKLYHARILVLGEKYALQGLCNRAAEYMQLHSTKLEASATAGDNANFLEYIIQLYEMSGPGSALRVPKIEDTVTSPTFPKPIAWNTKRAGIWIGSMWNDALQRHLVEEAFKRCPDLAQDLLIMIASGFRDKARGISH
ncbi:hypothetical protein L211DRAFT_852055 [Terfezia boudieri ATCC MYA-4762]|uniref:BTB domain-containing protein n=1 Tax=Terfezia boudieri ATCC MYA-4762 TaxID=1051890 RepID=A0A3N4LCR9_9PEZI|nr:hypothetical protein L211DRAFT_852055 [Terfezia boudieri ATCC MYA-4762]